jgi:long-chain acyl-CoA synthetase
MADGAALGDDRAMYRAAFVHWHTGKGSLLSPTPSTGQGCRLHHRSRSVFVSLGVAMTNVSVFLAESAEVEPDAVALRCGAASATYSELASDAARLAESLINGGVRPGDRVAIMLPNGPTFVVVLYGVWYAGGVAVPMSPSQSARGVEYVLTISDSRVLLFAPRRAVATAVAAVTAGTQPVILGKHGISRLIAGFRGRAEPVSRDADDTAVVLHTIATSSVPWWAELTHGDLVSNQTVIARKPLNLQPADVVMGCLPLWDGFGMICALLGTMFAAATLVLLPRFNAHTALKTIAAQHVTVFEGEPDMYPAMLGAADRCGLDFTSLRVCMSAGAPLPVDVLRRLEDRFGCIVLEGYELMNKRVMCFSRPEVIIDAQNDGFDH